MAKKKPRTPTPPRAQAPKRRVEVPGDSLARHRALLYGISGAGIVALLVIVLVVALGNGGGASAKKVAASMSAAGCTFKTVKAYVPPGQGVHVNSLTKKFPWNTDPPSNGQHYPLWAVWGFYTDPINPRQVVHNEEHGGVVLWWGPQVPSSTVNALQSFYQEQPDGMFGTPYSKLGSKIAITAWTGNPSEYGKNGYYGQGHIGTCSSWGPKVQKAFGDFRSAFRGHGPEGIPLSLDKPGMGPTSQ
ncbi:MAG TPA: DUF3105 domain-containing protein [Gaiellaceae bacterium]|nr:DUF3105 domain-containing protein [Gaiellaceae bacterium]